MYLRGVKQNSGESGSFGGEEVSEYLYETAWRCSQWSQDFQDESGVADMKGYHRSVFNCLSCLKDGEITSLQESLKEARYVMCV